MKLYYAPGACSLADRIALAEAGLSSEFVKVDLKSKRTDDGGDYLAVNPKGYVPALVLNNGEIITENAAILSWIAEQAPRLTPSGPLGRIRLIEALSFISSEIHKSFEPLFKSSASEELKAKAVEAVSKRYATLANKFQGPFLFGATFTVADPYLFVTLTWAKKFGVSVPDPLAAFFEGMMTRDSVRGALAREKPPGADRPADTRSSALEPTR